MFDFAQTARPSLSARRREAIRTLRPLLTSARLVRLFQTIGMLAVSRPSVIATIEVAVERMDRPRQARVAIGSEPARRRSTGEN